MVKNRAQSVMEYVLLIGIISLAVVAMQVYFKRAVNARLEEIRQEYSPTVAGSGGSGSGGSGGGSGSGEVSGGGGGGGGGGERDSGRGRGGRRRAY